MGKVTPVIKGPSLGFMARRVRTAQRLTQKQLAEMAGVSRQEVHLFEGNLPVALDVRRRLLKELWARKSGKL